MYAPNAILEFPVSDLLCTNQAWLMRTTHIKHLVVMVILLIMEEYDDVCHQISVDAVTY